MEVAYLSHCSRAKDVHLLYAMSKETRGM